jgi:Fe-Mn family superoxide dismutase
MQPPKESNLPSGAVAEAIDLQFGSFDSFKTEFAAAAKSVEGSGWAVLVKDGEDLHVMQVQNHNLLSVVDSKVILALDVWEHAYYLDYKNDRGAYVDKWFSLVNWGNVSSFL